MSSNVIVNNDKTLCCLSQLPCLLSPTLHLSSSSSHLFPPPLYFVMLLSSAHLLGLITLDLQTIFFLTRLLSMRSSCLTLAFHHHHFIIFQNFYVQSKPLPSFFLTIYIVLLALMPHLLPSSSISPVILTVLSDVLLLPYVLPILFIFPLALFVPPLNVLFSSSSSALTPWHQFVGCHDNLLSQVIYSSRPA